MIDRVRNRRLVVATAAIFLAVGSALLPPSAVAAPTVQDRAGTTGVPYLRVTACDAATYQDGVNDGYKRGYNDGYQNKPYNAPSSPCPSNAEYSRGYAYGYSTGWTQGNGDISQGNDDDNDSDYGVG